ncbi:MAG TPA: outer membrane lipoprotein carrier protein LolA [bacterium]|nr:outer membrane lipoprotein carrier protein LolA [bacterium]
MKRLFTLLIIFGLAASLSAQEAADLLGKIQKRYEAMKSVCADFTQTFNWELAGERQVFEGKICTRNGVQFRIETGDQLIVTDGKTVWTMPHGNKQVIIDDASENGDTNPFLKSFLKNYIDNYRSELLGTENLAGAPCHHIRLKANSADEFTQEVEIWADQKSLLMNKIKQTDMNGNTSTYEVRGIDLNARLTDATFRPEIPAGYEVVDMR